MTALFRSRHHLLMMLVILFAAASSGHAQEAQANAPHCSNINLSGGYGFLVNGTNPGVGPYSFLGQFVSDGKGIVTGAGVQAVNGVISRPGFTGTYAVREDCTGSASLKFDYGGIADLEFVIVDDGNSVDIIIAGANGGGGDNEVGTATRQFRQHRLPRKHPIKP